MPQLGEVGFRTKSVTTRTPTAPITDVVGVVGVMDIVGVPVVMDVVGVLLVMWLYPTSVRVSLLLRSAKRIL